MKITWPIVDPDPGHQFSPAWGLDPEPDALTYPGYSGLNGGTDSGFHGGCVQRGSPGTGPRTTVGPATSVMMLYPHPLVT